MSNVLKAHRLQMVLELGRRQWSCRRIQRETGVHRDTAREYLLAAGIPVRQSGTGRFPIMDPASPPSPDPAEAEPKPASAPSPDFGEGPAKPARGVSPDSPGPADQGRSSPGCSPVASACGPYEPLIREALARGRDGKAIWRDLRDDHGFSHAYASVKRFVAKLRAEQDLPQAHPFIVTEPGVESQVDYGEGPMVRNPETGKYRRTRLFVLALGYSRKAVRLLALRSSSRIWAELHERAYRRLGGAPRTSVLDNLREGVLEPDVYDPALNPLYAAVLKHYGVTPLPCRVRHSNRKGKVESGVGFGQRALRGLRFESLEEAQAYLDRWEERWADTRIHGTTKRQVSAMFAEEKPHLQPLPVEPFRYFQYGTRPVHINGCVEVAGGYYEAPAGWLGRTLAVEWDERVVRLLDPRTGRLLREDRNGGPGCVRRDPSHRGRRTLPGMLDLLVRARGAGESVGRLCEHLHREDEIRSEKRILGILRMVRDEGAARVEDACRFAMGAGIPSYRCVRKYLDHHPAVPLTAAQVDPLLRQLTEYRDVIRRMTHEEEET